jgi:hypothetical protein
MLYRSTWFRSASEINREVNNGRGAVDFKISRSPFDATVVEFKYAGSSKLQRNLKNQNGIYRRSCDARMAIFVIIFFTETERGRALRVLSECQQRHDQRIVLIDARRDNKPTGSMA